MQFLRQAPGLSGRSSRLTANRAGNAEAGRRLNDCRQRKPQRSNKRAMPKTTSQLKSGIREGKASLRRAPEVSVFMVCRRMVEQLRDLACAFNAQEMSKRVFMTRCKAVLSQLNEAAEATERFDIVLPVMDYGQFSPFFWRWFNWWDDYFKELTPRQAAHLEWLCKKLKPSADAHRPREHWLRYRHAAAFTLVIL
jgi:hypothetical protein